jgi:hypothetical protein
MDKAAIESECHALVLAYARNLDGGNGDALAEVFAEDGVWDRQGVPAQGRENIRKVAWASRPKFIALRQVITNFLLTIVDGEHAESTAYYCSYRHIAEDEAHADFPRPLEEPAYVGDYTNRFVRTPAGWRMSFHKAQRVFARPGVK